MKTRFFLYNEHMKYLGYYDSPLGTIKMVSDGEYLIELSFDKKCSKEYIEKNLKIFNQTRKWLDIYFSGDIPSFTPKYKLEGTEFRKQVWKYIEKIKYGESVSYKEIADMIAKKKGIDKMSAQAVGNAVGHNPICLIVPCHRVIGADGSLVGYAAGLDRKKKLLDLEGIVYKKTH